MDAFARSFLSRVAAGLSEARDLSGLADWVVANTRHPRDHTKPWSFSEHEFQRDILRDKSGDVVIKKAAQIGLSEVSVRMALGLIDIYTHSTAIYVLPTSSDAAVFAKSRFDPVILSSPELAAKIDKEVDNVSLKRIGDSFLYIRGTFVHRAAISIPASILLVDELDFCDQTVLTSYTSRLGHTKEGDIIKRRFSTPTVSGYGISELFSDSSQQWRAVKCDHCGSWEIVKFLDDVVIPGYGGTVINLEKEDLEDQRFNFREAYLACPKCSGKLTVDNLADPDKRQWVAVYPGHERSGYQAQSFDVPTINPIYRTLRQIGNYERKSDFFNFAIGQEFQDAETSFVKEAVRQAHCLDWTQPHINAASGCVIGIDVGKTSWITIAKPGIGGAMDVIHYERIKTTSEDTLSNRAVELFNWYGAQMLVIDAAPEWSQALAVVEKLPTGKAFASYYGSSLKPAMSFIIDVDEETHVVRVDRTAIISETAKRVNAGQIRFCRCAEQPTMEAHLDVVKKVRRPNAKGVEQDMWINAGGKPDHFAHSLVYAGIAKNLLGYSPKTDSVPTLPLPIKVRMGWLREDDRPRSYLDRR